MKRLSLLCLVFSLAACAPAPAPIPAAATPQVLNVAFSDAAKPWLAELTACAADQTDVILAAPPLGEADVTLRVGEPDVLAFPAYQVGSEEIVVVVNPQNPLAGLTEPQVRDLFTGKVQNWSVLGGADAPVNVWVFDSGNDVWMVFDGALLRGRTVISTARLAAGADQMREAVADDVNAIGVLPKHWAAANVKILPAETPILAPVLAIVPAPPDDALARLIACSQQKTAP